MHSFHTNIATPIKISIKHGIYYKVVFVEKGIHTFKIRCDWEEGLTHANMSPKKQ